MYDKFKDEKTSLGVTLDKCIRGGVDRAQLGQDWNVGKVGVLFGDAECVTKFGDLMRPIIVARHNNPSLPHPAPNLDGSKLNDHTKMDASYVISTRVRTGRSISGFPLPPSISADQRKELEGIVTKALSTLDGELKGDYYPLAGSNTYEPKPNGIDVETEKRLIQDHFLFQAPDEPMLLSWRMERDWPHARGIYHNEAKSSLVWVNEEDHLRIISMEKGNNARAVFDRFAGLVNAVEKACKDAGKGLEISEKYGNILSCPSNCGTGLRASMMIKIPLTSKRADFKAWCDGRKLQARGSGGFASKTADDGIRDVSNVDRMGKDEVELVNEMIKGVTDLITWEKALETNPEAPAP
jgi:creatine kinase